MKKEVKLPITQRAIDSFVHFIHCAYSEIAAIVLKEQGRGSFPPYYTSHIFGKGVVNIYPSEVFTAWKWELVDRDGNIINDDLFSERFRKGRGIHMTVRDQDKVYEHTLMFEQLQEDAFVKHKLNDLIIRSCE